MHRLLKPVALAAGLLGVMVEGALAQTTPAPTVSIAPAATRPCTGTPDPYANYNCLDAYLGDNPFIIDSYVSHLTGREPAHVRFIRSVLRKKAPAPAPKKKKAA